MLLPVVLLSLPESWYAEAWLGAKDSLIIQWCALLVACCGLLLRVAAVAFAPDGSSSRETHRLRATTLNTTGAYSLLRHPLYAGSALMWVGTAMSLRVWWLVVIVALVYALYVERMVVIEEAFLLESFGGRFTAWAAKTPAFWPRLSGWQSPAFPIQWRRVMSEHNGLLAVALVFAVLEFAEDELHGGQPWRVWYSDHYDLVDFVILAAIISAVCIIGRRIRGLPSWSPAEG